MSQEEISRRRDLRDLKTFTMDGADAKDLDDAISIERNEEGNLLGVHIADVSITSLKTAPWIRRPWPGNQRLPGGQGNTHAAQGTLNGICSLNPNRDRLTMSVIMEVDKNGKVLDYSIERLL